MAFGSFSIRLLWHRSGSVSSYWLRAIFSIAGPRLTKRILAWWKDLVENLSFAPRESDVDRGVGFLIS